MKVMWQFDLRGLVEGVDGHRNPSSVSYANYFKFSNTLEKIVSKEENLASDASS